jgi:hypothetical protein
VGKHTALLAGGIAAVAVTFASLPVAHADPDTDAADLYYFSKLAAENTNPYDPTNQTGWRITDSVSAIETGHWLCNRVGVYGVLGDKAINELIARSRVEPWGFVWSSPDPRAEFVGGEGIQIAALDAYCPQYYSD